jgi:hypothetical protein
VEDRRTRWRGRPPWTSAEHPAIAPPQTGLEAASTSGRLTRDLAGRFSHSSRYLGYVEPSVGRPYTGAKRIGPSARPLELGAVSLREAGVDAGKHLSRAGPR